MRFHWFFLFCAAMLSSLAYGADGNAILNKDCVSCHNLKGPAPQSLKELWARKGPDLFYAGNKYREEWVISWLQKPQRIRPAGEFYRDHIKRGDKRDEIDTATLKDHVALSKEDATAVAAALMQLKPKSDLIAREKLEPGTISDFMGRIVFDKALGCMACHRDGPDEGGLSGPELYTAAKRLQPEYIASYIRSPQAWDPKIWMPNKHVSDANIQKLVYFLELLGGGAQ
jgi:mono/diheme cytochrome c family protein